MKMEQLDWCLLQALKCEVEGQSMNVGVEGCEGPGSRAHSGES